MRLPEAWLPCLLLLLALHRPALAVAFPHAGDDPDNKLVEARAWLTDAKRPTKQVSDHTVYTVDYAKECEAIPSGNNKQVCHVKGHDFALAVCVVGGQCFTDVPDEIGELKKMKAAGVHVIPFDGVLRFVSCPDGKSLCLGYLSKWVHNASSLLIHNADKATMEKALTPIAHDKAKLHVAKADLETAQAFVKSTHGITDLQCLFEPATGHAFIFDPMGPLDPNKRPAGDPKLTLLIGTIDELSAKAK